MGEMITQLGNLPTLCLMLVLGGVMLLDAVPLLGVLVPGDVAVLAVVSVGRPVGGISAFVSVIGGCLTGWSLSFLAGRHFGDRIRQGWFGAWVGEARWTAAERLLRRGGGRMVMVAPFLPVLNALLPLAAGGLRMSYRRFVACATVGSVLWAGLYVLLAVAARSLGGLLPGETFAMVGTVAIGLVFGWLVLLSIRRRLGIAALEDA
ncbi:VTT domain-containing protein [Solwaraspora sp. WMMD1047]|uniref:DedA family protein n=1 Tax=Solwaraspora sp. WMMD1047 TaxID=3016102 RepID=UPI0024165866|nr:VTT domain-containing protein [Solwaraspora sp. WMMD1047]MDG4831942.1 VTT domain-containing protein [Solwaraspora sp. WMMD1047]